jgi:ArsR family transcriptional regulator, arsenate/arsenite/antimonite-responsive transcriptional repressor
MDNRCSVVFIAMGNETRLKILELLKQRELCVSEICKHFKMSQPSISHHLDMLKRAGLVESEKRGREVYYKMNGNTIVECCGKQFKLFNIILRKA